MFFDNLQVTHIKGPILEETHSYPFGLTMAGVSSKAAGGMENRAKFNEGTELNTDLELSWYETPHRGYDPQIGRFHQIDPLIEYAYDWSTYAFANNNPILLNDPSGLISDSAHKAIILPEVVIKNRPQSASDKVINDNWFIRFFAAREVKNMDRALDAYQNGGINNYLYTSIRNAHSESMLEFSTGGYINPWNRTLAIVNKTNLTRSSVHKKLMEYLLNHNHSRGKDKAIFFEKALGFTKDNADDLAKQIVFDPAKAVLREVTPFGPTYRQVIPITGANGRTIEVAFGWIRNNDNVVRLTTAFPD